MKKKQQKRVLLGRFAVDSGQFMIIDPCYVLGKGYELTKEQYDKICKITNKTTGGEIKERLAVVSRTRDGDGCYPVYAIYDHDGRLSKIEIEFE